MLSRPHIRALMVLTACCVLGSSALPHSGYTFCWRGRAGAMALATLFFAAGIVVSVFSLRAVSPERLSDSSVNDNTSVVSSSVGLALEGGGFLSHAAFTGLTVGFMKGLRARSKQYRGKTDEHALEALFSNVDVISSVSGGSWFFAGLAYSESFSKQVCEMAKLSREDIYQIYDRDFIEPILNVGKGMELNNTVAKKFVKWLADHGHPGIAEDYGAVLFMLRNKLAWRDFMNVFLGVLGVDASMHTIGSSVQRWARKKIWIAGTAVATPGSPTGEGGKRATSVFAWSKDADMDYMKYSSVTKHGHPVPIYSPARFSAVLGAQGSCPAPLCRQ